MRVYVAAGLVSSTKMGRIKPRDDHHASSGASPLPPFSPREQLAPVPTSPTCSRHISHAMPARLSALGPSWWRPQVQVLEQKEASSLVRLVRRYKMSTKCFAPEMRVEDEIYGESIARCNQSKLSFVPRRIFGGQQRTNGHTICCQPPSWILVFALAHTPDFNQCTNVIMTTHRKHRLSKMIMTDGNGAHAVKMGQSWSVPLADTSRVQVKSHTPQSSAQEGLHTCIILIVTLCRLSLRPAGYLGLALAVVCCLVLCLVLSGPHRTNKYVRVPHPHCIAPD